MDDIKDLSEARRLVTQLRGEVVSLKAWKEAVLNECVMAHIGWDEANPRDTLAKVIEWNNQVALDPLVSKEARDLQNTLAGEVDALRRELDVSQAETASWKSAHADMVKRNAILRDRPDLPVDRTMAHDHLVQAQRSLEAERTRFGMMKTAYEVELTSLRQTVIAQGDILTGVANALKGNPGTDASHSTHDLAELAELAVDQGASAIATQARRNTLGDVLAMRAVRATPEELDDWLVKEYEALPDAATAQAEAEDDYALIMKQGGLLEGVANALKGPPAPLSRHSVHDLPEVAATRVAELDMAKATIERMETELAQCHETAHIRSKEVTRLTMKANMLETRAEKAEGETLAAIGELAAIKFSLLAPPADMQTERKAQDIMIRTGMKKQGYILQAPSGGGAALVHLGAVRWLSDGELWEAVHPGEAPRE